MPDAPGWRDDARALAYPFIDDCSRRPTDGGGWTLPDGLFVDARLNVPADTTAVFLSTLSVNAGLAGTIRLVTAGSPAAGRPLGSFALAVDGQTDRVDVVDAHGIVRGTLVIDPATLAAIPARPATVFSPTAAVFLSSTWFRYPAAVLTGLSGGDAFGTGRVAIRAGAGIRLVAEPFLAPAGRFDTIRVDAVGAPTDLSDCFGPLGDPIVTVNNIQSDARGDFRFEPDQYAEPNDSRDVRQVLKIEPEAFGLRFRLARETF